MKYLYLMLAICVFASCDSISAKSKKSQVKAKPAQPLPVNKKAGNPTKAIADTITDEMLDAYADYYVIVADTGTNYEELKNKMFALQRSSNLVIDTMGRSYNKAKDLIALADNDEDDMYAGDYYPRRYVSSTLSLEYLETYMDARPKTIALIAGIYENKTSADSALKIMGDHNARAIKGHIYVGCMH